jgi:hypothetical protein
MNIQALSEQLLLKRGKKIWIIPDNEDLDFNN